ncbi:DNA polymerase delta subunit 3 [Ananas comosus]|uniref:DNA polymerase delta subunit 3 n=1 Tax=Ananas comosus TaxID=4615 RepID=A0A199VY48_ANACO|nr:DNA polymerase delta subunit 3 [Ananas comosus]
MAEGVDLDLLPQILSLASDRLQVITYKWLSRNFSISSNCAKGLLQEFVKKHGEELEVIYTLSGWLKSNPQTYCVKLASGLKLEDVRKEFKDTCSIQVYSVQACIPKDVAVLWSAEFVQAEELFNQPSNEENCLRDNRFCGVSNSFVKRTVNGKHVSPTPPKPVIATGAAWQSKSSSILKDQTVHVQPPQQGLSGQSSSKHESTDKSDIATSANINTANKLPPVKEPTVAVLTSKQKDKNGKDSLGNTGSLASLWGRASAKSKPPNSATETTNDIPSVSVTAEAQIRAKEAANAASSDDEHDANLRRESNHASGRKRRVVFDFSDDDDEENVVSLASPDSPKKHVAAASTNAENLTLKETSLAQKRETLEKRQENVKGLNSDLSSKANMSSGGNSSNGGITLKLKNQSDNSEPNANENNTDQTTNAASASPKRRKVLKTRIDERGREVTEVVWEGESAPSEKTDKHTATDNAGNRPTAANKRQAAVSSNLPSKTAGNKKPAKAGGKDAKQGNILSFFRKI